MRSWAFENLYRLPIPRAWILLGAIVTTWIITISLFMAATNLISLFLL